MDLKFQLFMVSNYIIGPLQCCIVASKTAAGEQSESWDRVLEIPYCSEILSLTLPQLAATSNKGTQ